MVPVAVALRETPAYGEGAGRLRNGTGAVSFFAAYGPLQKVATNGGGRLLSKSLVHALYLIGETRHRRRTIWNSGNGQLAVRAAVYNNGLAYH